MKIIIDFLPYAVIFIILFTVFYYKTIKLYYYTVGCLKNIKDDDFLQGKYMMTIDDIPEENIKMSLFNILYMYVIIPEELKDVKLQMQYLQEHLQRIEDALSVQNLYGLIETKKRKFVTKDDKKINLIYLIKFQPIFYNLTIFRFFLFIVSLLVSFFVYNFYFNFDFFLNLVK